MDINDYKSQFRNLQVTANNEQTIKLTDKKYDFYVFIVLKKDDDIIKGSSGFTPFNNFKDAYYAALQELVPYLKKKKEYNGYNWSLSSLRKTYIAMNKHSTLSKDYIDFVLQKVEWLSNEIIYEFLTNLRDKKESI